MSSRTSDTHPLIINTITLPAGGRIGMTFCPGKQQTTGMTGAWHRDLDTDLHALQDWRPSAIIGCPEAHEYAMLQVPDIAERMHAKHLDFIPFPFADDTVPTPEQQAHWDSVIEPYLIDILQGGGGIVIFCKGGLGRTGLLASFLLTAMGVDNTTAVNTVRAHRPLAIYTPEQDTLAHTRVPVNHPFPRAMISIDLAILALDGEGIPHIGLTQRTTLPFIGQHALLGGMIHTDSDTTPGDTVQRILRAHAIEPAYLEQVCTQANNHRDPRGWSLSTVYLVLCRQMTEHPAIQWYPLTDLPTSFAFDHQVLIRDAIDRMRNKSTYSLLPIYTIPMPASIGNIMEAYRRWVPDNHIIDPASFRRKILHTGKLHTNQQAQGERGAPRALYTMPDGVDPILERPLVLPMT